MGGFGWHNPFPFEFGGGPTLDERVYNELRNAVGIGGSSRDEDNSIDALWRQAKAKGLAVGRAFDEKAVLESFPNLSEYHLPAFEDLLSIIPSTGQTIQERRDIVTAAYTERLSGIVPEVRAALQAIDTRLDVISSSWDTDDTTEPGRPFEDASESYGGTRNSTAFPLYSTRYIFFVLFDLGGGGAVPTLEEQSIMEDAKRLLNKVLPTWCDFVIGTEAGIILDQTPLDVGMFSP